MYRCNKTHDLERAEVENALLPCRTPQLCSKLKAMSKFFAIDLIITMA
jgi:hypothetical protein